ncbi:unnamed protein product [Vicia faba]|uniref:Uncharacterized protein n=1 Tax=Vicia faba TaxID=3906 RepID=A0AAV1AYC9_VICFA|nr:unnamed protein product [Vicia faba]
MFYAISETLNFEVVGEASNLDVTMERAQENNGIHPYILDDESIDAKAADDESIDAKSKKHNQVNQETDEAREEDMEIGYDDRPSTPTYEGFEQIFIDEIMKLVREQSDKEDTKFCRHNEVTDVHGYLCPLTIFIAGEATSSSMFHGATEYSKYVGESTECLTTSSNGIKTS